MYARTDPDLKENLMPGDADGGGVAHDRRGTPDEPLEGRARLGHRPGLDGLRAIAIILVLLRHTAAFLVPAWQNDFLPAGFLGVDLFFVLSGFLITTLLLERHSREPHPIGNFYLRRVLRLFPAVVVLLFANLVFALITSKGVSDALSSFPPVVTYTTNWAELHGVVVSHYITHLWSLAIEGQFYLVWPLVLFGAIRFGCSRRQMLWLVLGVALLVALWRAEMWRSGEVWLTIYLRTDARLDSILIGAALALLPYDRLLTPLRPWARTLLGWAALATLVAAAELLQPSSATLYLGGFTAVAIVAAVLIAVELQPGTGLHPFLVWGPLAVVGRLSYSLYLWHFPVFLVVADHTSQWTAPKRVLLAWCLTFAAAAASYRLVELPVLRRKDRVGAQPLGPDPKRSLHPVVASPWHACPGPKRRVQ
jgi:peptidoglycan/LPS O-acetylase OafA/YrhL